MKNSKGKSLHKIWNILSKVENKLGLINVWGQTDAIYVFHLSVSHKQNLKLEYWKYATVYILHRLSDDNTSELDMLLTQQIIPVLVADK